MPWDMLQETQRSAGCSEIKAVTDKEARLKQQVQFGFPGRVYLKNNYYEKKPARAQMTRQRSLWLKGEAARHNKVSPWGLPWGKVCGQDSCLVHISPHLCQPIH